MAFCRVTLQFPISFVLGSPGTPSKQTRESAPESAGLKKFTHSAYFDKSFPLAADFCSEWYITLPRSPRGRTWRSSVLGLGGGVIRDKPCVSHQLLRVFHLFHPVQLSLRSLQQQTAKPHTSLLSSHYCWCITRRRINWNLNTAYFWNQRLHCNLLPTSRSFF